MFLFWGRFFDDISDGFFCSKKQDFVEEMKPNEFYFMVCWEKFQVFFPWSLVHRDRDMRIGMLLHLPGALSKTTVFFGFKRTCKQF